MEQNQQPPHILAFQILGGMMNSFILSSLIKTEVFEMLDSGYYSLNEGGMYVILDQIKGIGGSSQMSKATTSYMALNLLHQAGGKTYSRNEVELFTQKAGFKKTELKKLNAPGFGVIICSI